jgi:hypothetical protein
MAAVTLDRPAHLALPRQPYAGPGRRRRQPRPVRRRGERRLPERPARRGRGAGEGLGELAVGPGQQLDDAPAAGAQHVEQVGVGVEQRQDDRLRAERDHVRADRQPGPLGVVAGRPEGDGAADVAAEAPGRVGIGVRERVRAVDGHACSLGTTSTHSVP